MVDMFEKKYILAAAGYSYSIDGDKTMTIWEDNCILATISDVDSKNAREIFADVVYELRGINVDDVKPTVEIIGTLCYMLKSGYRAYIDIDKGETIMTSQVLDVRNETESGVEIETLNTIYKLTYATAQTAA